MPTPIGHALGGVIAGWCVGGRRALLPSSPTASREARPHGARRGGAGAWVPLAVLGMVPDLDLLFHTHSTYSHSVGAVILAAAVVTVMGRLRGFATARAAWLRVVGVVAAAYGSHLLLDWLATDTTPPFGILALWPFSSDFYTSGLSWFPPVPRDVFSVRFWTGIPVAVLYEVLWLGPLALLVGHLRGARTHAGAVDQ